MAEEAEDIISFPLPNGRMAQVFPLTFNRARIGLVSLENPFCYDDVW